MTYKHVSRSELLPRESCLNPERTVPPSVFSYHSQYLDSSNSVTIPDQTHANVNFFSRKDLHEVSPENIRPF